MQLLISVEAARRSLLPFSTPFYSPFSLLFLLSCSCIQLFLTFGFRRLFPCRSVTLVHLFRHSFSRSAYVYAVSLEHKLALHHQAQRAHSNFLLSVSRIHCLFLLLFPSLCYTNRGSMSGRVQEGRLGSGERRVRGKTGFHFSLLTSSYLRFFVFLFNPPYTTLSCTTVYIEAPG